MFAGEHMHIAASLRRIRLRVREHMCVRANEKWKLNWTDGNGSECEPRRAAGVSARMTFPHQVTVGVGWLACHSGIRWLRDGVLSSQISTLISPP